LPQSQDSDLDEVSTVMLTYNPTLPRYGTDRIQQ